MRNEAQAELLTALIAAEREQGNQEIEELNQSQCGMYILRTAIRSQGSRLDRRGGFQTRPYQWTAGAPASPPAMKRYLA